MRSFLITGGAGFVGSSLAVALKQASPAARVVALDSLKRRGSELSLPRLQAHGVTFLHGDIRCAEDLAEIPPCEVVIDCSAEPSVLAGISGSPVPVLQNNLFGTMQCLEVARKWNAAFLFLSTSRVYPIQRLNDLAWNEAATRFAWTHEEQRPGYSAAGVAEDFPLAGPRSLYGATKLAGELLVQEYAHLYNMPAMINRCGILTGPWQMGKVDQGVVTLWIARHLFDRPLKYIGFGGEGKQVRDMLHIDDLTDLIRSQLSDMSAWNGSAYNVGGGYDVSASLLELTGICQEVTSRHVPIQREPTTNAVDLRIFLTDSTRVRSAFNWAPRKSVWQIVEDIHGWIGNHRAALQAVFS